MWRTKRKRAEAGESPRPVKRVFAGIFTGKNSVTAVTVIMKGREITMDEIKLTLDAEPPRVPALTLEGAQAPSLTLAPEEKPEEKAEPVVLDESILSPEEQKVVNEFADKIDLTNSTMVMQYGAAAQKKIASFSDSALDKVKTKDLGEVGEDISNLVVELKGFDIDEEEKKGFLASLKIPATRLPP